MKTKLLILFILMNIKSFSQIVRVGPGMNMQNLLNSAVPGTVFLVEGGNFGKINVNKRAVIIGTGYNLENTQVSVFSDFNLNVGSEGSTISSIYVTGIMKIGDDNITIQKTKIGNELRLGCDSSNYREAKNILIKQNLIKTINGTYSISRYYDGFVVKNNLIENTIVNIESQGIIQNNTININLSNCQSSITSAGSLMYNNIILPPSYSCVSGASVGFSHNIISSGQFNTSDNSNVKLINFDGVFIGYPTHTGLTMENRWMLTPNSPAKGAGVGGVDCGAFVGVDSYISNGLPTGPYIYEVNAPSSAAAGQTIPVTIKARVQN